MTDQTVSGASDRADDGAAVADAVAAVVETIFSAIAEIADTYRSLWVELTGAGRAVEAADLVSLRDVVHRRLEGSVVKGYGVVVAPGVLRDRQRHLEWWEQGLGGRPPVRLVLDLDPTGEDSYDYPSMPWFAIPRDEDRRTAFGPYVDFRGANTYVYTVAVPVRAGGLFLGVAGADVPVQNLEPALLAALKPLSADAVVVGSDRRVIVANSGRWSVGSRLKSFPEAGVGDVVAVHPVGVDPGWVLAVMREPLAP